MKTMEQKNAEVVTAFIEDIANQGMLEKTDQFFAPQIVEAGSAVYRGRNPGPRREGHR